MSLAYIFLGIFLATGANANPSQYGELKSAPAGFVDCPPGVVCSPAQQKRVEDCDDEVIGNLPQQQKYVEHCEFGDCHGEEHPCPPDHPDCHQKGQQPPCPPGGCEEIIIEEEQIAPFGSKVIEEVEECHECHEEDQHHNQQPPVHQKEVIICEECEECRPEVCVICLPEDEGCGVCEEGDSECLPPCPDTCNNTPQPPPPGGDDDNQTPPPPPAVVDECGPEVCVICLPEDASCGICDESDLECLPPCPETCPPLETPSPSPSPEFSVALPPNPEQTGVIENPPVAAADRSRTAAGIYLGIAAVFVAVNLF